MYEDRILAYIDILGFSDVVNDTIKDGIENTKKTERIYSLIDDIHTDLNMFGKYFEIKPLFNNSKIVSQFSDTIIISYSKKEESGIFQILLDILFLCIIAISKGLLLRGAIVSDKIYHTNEKIFGPALINAYKMEQKMAIYPRIILDEDIINLSRIYHAYQNSPDEEEKYVRHILKLDSDGIFYIDYFESIESVIGMDIEEMPIYFNQLRKSIVNMFDKIYDFGIKIKYLWTKERYNNVITKYKENYNCERVKNEFPELFKYYKDIQLL